MRRESLKAIILGVISTALLGVLVAIGSRNLAHFDAALVGYTFATLFAVFAITYRYAIWLQRPPTALYWRRGWQVFLDPRHFGRNIREGFKRFVSAFALNNFIWRRSWRRGLAHWLIMWGCVTAALVTFPLVFGWIHFATEPGDFEHYRVFVFGFPTIKFAVDGFPGFLLFHALVWSALLVIPGVMIAMYRRMRDHGAGALQQFGEDFLPLILLFSISMTGLMMTASYTWMKGYGYDFLAILHAVTVIFTLLWLPFGKFFHIFQRPAQLGVSLYRDIGAKSEQAKCARCNKEYASRMHVEDLIIVERQLGYRYELENQSTDHYQRICPQCRRAMLALAQGRLWDESRGFPRSQPVADVAEMLAGE